MSNFADFLAVDLGLKIAVFILAVLALLFIIVLTMRKSTPPPPPT
jgi:hypothetical protein